MKKTVFIKGILLIVLSIVCFATSGVYAANSVDGVLDEEEETVDFTSTKSNTNNEVNKSNTNNVNNANIAKNNTNTANKNNASVYNKNNNTNLPKTGVADSIPTMVLVVIFGISSVYALKKVKEYNKI